MTCPRPGCHGLLVPDFDHGLWTWRCVNCGWRPALQAVPGRDPRPQTGRPHRPRATVVPERSILVSRVAACAAQLTHAPTKREFDAFCERAGYEGRAQTLCYAPGDGGSGWRSWLAILREAGVQPSIEQIRKSENRRGSLTR